tara:strand:+ start:6101 stop:6850 length:750 start_codon:yes stop_codon:yes gene_type:complete
MENKNNVAVFGDSFTDPRANKMARYATWSSNYTSYGKDGSDIYYSYLQFLEHHEKHDKIIFAVTDCNRHSRQYNDNEWRHFSDPNTLDMRLASAETWEDKQVYSTLRNWFRYIVTNNNTRELNISNILVNEIKRIRPDTLFIKLFENSPGPNVLYLLKISNLEKGNISIGDWREASYYGKVDTRLQHLTRETHAVITNEIKKAWTNGDQWLDMDYDMFKNIKFDKDSYFVDWESTYNPRKTRKVRQDGE